MRSKNMESKLSRTFKKFLELTNIPVQDKENLKKIGNSWNYSTYPNKLKDFFYKFIFNKLILNTRLSHMRPMDRIDRSCTLCKQTKNSPTP